MDLTAQNLIFSYGNRKIIDQPALELTPGKLTFLLGANGSGKSTLLKLLSGLLKPEQGDIFLNGTSLQKISYHSRAKHIGVMLQQRLPALDFSAEEFVLLGRTPKLPRLAAPGKSHKDAVNHALSLLDMEKFAKRPANRLSGGEFQRLCLASVLALESEILLLDEPVSAQDPARAAFIFELLKQLAAQKTILVISHGLELANRYAERLLLFSNGSVFADGTPREIMTQDNLNKLYNLPGFTAVPGNTFHFQREQAQK